MLLIATQRFGGNRANSGSDLNAVLASTFVNIRWFSCLILLDRISELKLKDYKIDESIPSEIRI